MSGDSKQQFKAVSSFEYFSIAIDESVDISEIAWLTVFIRACDREFNTHEDLIEPVLCMTLQQTRTSLRKSS